jgi:hypothetical protein
MTSALDGEWSASRPDRALPPEKGPPVRIGQEAGWAPEPQTQISFEIRNVAKLAKFGSEYWKCSCVKHRQPDTQWKST